MKRTKLTTPPDFILTSDWHLREDQPICRTDDFWAAQWRKVRTIAKLQQTYGCPVIHAGDLFHHWKPSPHLLNMAIQHLPKKLYIVYGQHDLPQHNIELAYKCGVAVLDAAKVLTILPRFHFGEEPTSEYPYSCWNQNIKEDLNFDYHITVIHKLVWTGAQPWPGCTDPTAEKVLDTFPVCPLIVTGDNHKSFVVEKDDRFLVNPGCLTRQTASECDYKPSVYLWWTSANYIKRIYLPVDDGVISREHIDRVKERDERIAAFISRVDTKWQAEISFGQNLEIWFKANDTENEVKEIIMRAIE